MGVAGQIVHLGKLRDLFSVFHHPRYMKRQRFWSLTASLLK